MRYRNRDPYWLTAKFNSKCKCGAPVNKGDQAFYYPSTRTILGKACGCADEASGDFEAARFDEAQYSGSW